jgi:RcsF protein
MSLFSLRNLSCVAVTLALTACAGEYGFKSNLDPKAINEYFKPSQVTVFDANSSPSAPFKRLKLVSGETCQVKENDAPASIADARTLARRAAADLGANGIIIQNCQLIEVPEQDCVSRALCVAQAIKINQQ